MPPTERQILANRRNALKSTGPRTVEGKGKVSLNALKHGILSKELIVRNSGGTEDPREYAVLYSAIHAHYQPLGAMEELLVERIAVCNWRLKRVLRAERDAFEEQIELVAHGGLPQHIKIHIGEFGVNPKTGKLERWEDFEDEEEEEEEELPTTPQPVTVPKAGVLDQLMKYEKAIDRQLNSVQAQLERLQRRRLGEAVPPPLNINVAGNL
jgi:hypothetical protein